MKRNKHHGLNVEFDGLCMDFGHVSLNKRKNFSVGTAIRLKKMMKTMFWCFLTDLGAE